MTTVAYSSRLSPKTPFHSFRTLRHPGDLLAGHAGGLVVEAQAVLQAAVFAVAVGHGGGLVGGDQASSPAIPSSAMLPRLPVRLACWWAWPSTRYWTMNSTSIRPPGRA
jgi:hypothetical protein